MNDECKKKLKVRTEQRDEELDSKTHVTQQEHPVYNSTLIDSLTRLKVRVAIEKQQGIKDDPAN